MKTFKQFFTDDVDIYKKDAQDLKPDLVATVDPEYYKDTLTKYIKLGSIDSAEVRNIVIQRLTTANGLISNNLELFQGLVMDLDLNIVDPANFDKCETKFIETIKNNTSTTIDEIIFAGFGKSVTDSPYYKQCWSAWPEAPVIGNPGEGELFLSFFCNGTKPKKGDIQIGDFQIELKGPGGRLYKNRNQIAPYEPEMVELLTIDFNANEAQLRTSAIDNYSQYIANVSGYSKGVDQIKDLLSDNEFLIKQLNRESFEFVSGYKNKLRNGNSFFQLAGYVQIYAYKEEFGFNALAVFGPKPGFYIYGLVIPDTIKELYRMINSSHTDTVKGVYFQHRIDGTGDHIKLSIK